MRLDSDEITRRRDAFTGDPPTVPVRPTAVSITDSKDGARYRRDKLLGVGGMGEVHLCHDERIGRLIAMKIIDERRARSTEVRGRFLTEARIQGQLQHPSIVPVYDLDKTDKGIDYFTMKRVSGATLERIVDALFDENRAMATRFPQERLLGVFRRLCQCLEYVHAAGVIHRDIKPGNIMVGDYGEVFLLDWGLAKLSPLAREDSSAGRTRRGQVLGTPGYMSPEQAVDAQNIDARADVYSLGCILFEMLTYEPFLKGKNARELMRATQLGSDERASERAPHLDIPPELDDVCLRATRRDPDHRFESVQQMRAAIDRYLEGERDVDLRERLAARHVTKAASMAAHAGMSQKARHHAQAVREAGRALALDPKNERAQELLMQLMLEAPEEGAEQDKRRDQRMAASIQQAKRAGGLAAMAYGSFLVVVTVLGAAQGVKSYPAFFAIIVPLLVGFTLAMIRRRSNRPESTLGVSANIAGSIAIAASATVAGTMVLLPVLTTANTLAFGTSENLRDRRKVMLAAGCLALLVPALLEWAGVLPRVYAFTGDRIIVTPTTFHLSAATTPISLFVVSALAIAVPLVAVWRISDEMENRRRRLHERLWHLRQLLPELTQMDRLTASPAFENVSPERRPLGAPRA